MGSLESGLACKRAPSEIPSCRDKGPSQKVAGEISGKESFVLYFTSNLLVIVWDKHAGFSSLYTLISEQLVSLHHLFAISLRSLQSRASVFSLFGNLPYLVAINYFLVLMY